MPHTDRNFTPITDDATLLELVHGFNGHKKHDEAFGATYGLARFQVSVLRQLVGKIEFATVRHSPELKDAVVNDYEDGKPTIDIASDHGISVSAVYGILKSCHIDRARRDFWHSPIKIRRLIDLRERQKLSWAEIGKAMGRTLKCCQAKYTHIKRLQSIPDLYDNQHLSWEEIGKKVDMSPRYCKDRYEYIKKTGNVF